MVKKLRKSIERSLRNRGAHNSVKFVILAILPLYSCKRAQAGRRSTMKYGIWLFTGECEDMAGYQRQAIGLSSMHVRVYVSFSSRVSMRPMSSWRLWLSVNSDDNVIDFSLIINCMQLAN